MEECQKAFDYIKFLLSNPPILRMPDMTGISRFMSDTSTLSAGSSSIPISRLSFLYYRIQLEETTKSSTKLFRHRP